MSKFSIKIVRAVLLLCIFITTTHGQKGCNCRCSVLHYGDMNVCEWVNNASPKVDSNFNQVMTLKEENSKFTKFKNYFEKNMNDKVLPFTLTNSQKPILQHAPENMRANTDEPVVDLAAEIETLKKILKDQRDELEDKIEKIEKNCLRITDNLLARVEEAEVRAVQAENAVSQRLTKTEEHALKMGEKISGQEIKNEDRILEIKGEILETILETENLVFNLSNGLYVIIKDVEAETKKLKDDFLVRTNEQKNETARVKHEFLVKVNDLENEASKLKGVFLQKATELENGTSNVKDDMLNITRNMDNRLGDMDKIVANLTFILNDYHAEQQLYNRTFNAFKLNTSSTILELQAKTEATEKVLEKLPSKEISSNITDLWYSIDSIRNSMTRFQRQIDAVKKTRTLDKKDNTPKEKVRPKKVCEASKNKQEPTLEAVFRAFDQEQKNCGDVLLADYYTTSASNKSASSLTSALERQNTIDQLLLLVLRKPVGGEEYENVCIAVIISRHWAITSAHCVNDNMASYRVNQVKKNSISFSYQEVRPFIYDNFKLSFAPYDNDIALLNSQKLFSFDARKTDLSVACLPTPETKDKLFGSAIFVGWSDLKNSDWFLSLHVYDVCLVSDDECSRFYDPETFDNSMICTQYDRSAFKSCEGSKGGLLFKKIGNKAVLIGIAVNCGSPDKPIVYNEIAYFADWIEYFPQVLGKSD